MPKLEEAFFNFPLSITVNEWKQPYGVCNTLAIAWLEEKYLDGNFWQGDLGTQRPPAKPPSSYRDEHLAYGNSGESASQWAASKFSKSEHDKIRNIQVTSPGASSGHFGDFISTLSTQLTSFEKLGALISVTGAIAPHAMAAFFNGKDINFFDPNLGEAEVEANEFEVWLTGFYEAWKDDTTYKNYCLGPCVVTYFRPSPV